MNSTHARSANLAFTRKNLIRFLQERREASMTDLLAHFRVRRWSSPLARDQFPDKLSVKLMTLGDQPSRNIRWLLTLQTMETAGEIVVTSDRKWVRLHSPAQTK